MFKYILFLSHLFHSDFLDQMISIVIIVIMLDCQEHRINLLQWDLLNRYNFKSNHTLLRNDRKSRTDSFTNFYHSCPLPTVSFVIT